MMNKSLKLVKRWETVIGVVLVEKIMVLVEGANSTRWLCKSQLLCGCAASILATSLTQPQDFLNVSFLIAFFNWEYTCRESLPQKLVSDLQSSTTHLHFIWMSQVEYRAWALTISSTNHSIFNWWSSADGIIFSSFFFPTHHSFQSFNLHTMLDKESKYRLDQIPGDVRLIISAEIQAPAEQGTTKDEWKEQEEMERQRR